MEVSSILHADVLDIIFEGKNKSYGAYDLRKTYSKRLLLSIGLMLTVILLLWISLLFGRNPDQASVKPLFDDSVVIITQTLPKEEVKLPEAPAPAPKTQAPEKPVETIRNTVPVIVPNDQVNENDKPPVVEDLDKARISNVTTPGDPDAGLAPPIEGPAGNGTRVTGDMGAGTRKEVDSIFTKVEIESYYPGGMPAWSRFLNKTIGGRYPQEALDKGIQGKVIVQFVVDQQGAVSDIQILDGPQELREAAIRAIQKSGKWVPAEQNGRKVKSYKKQPFVFQLPEE